MDIETGIDIIEIDRVRSNIERHGERFLSRIFTPKERAYCDGFEDSAPRYAGRFACKEAIIKALGESRGWHDMEILNDEKGRPNALLSAHYAQQVGEPELRVSISHCHSHATAICIVKRK